MKGGVGVGLLVLNRSADVIITRSVMSRNESLVSEILSVK